MPCNSPAVYVRRRSRLKTLLDLTRQREFAFKTLASSLASISRAFSTRMAATEASVVKTFK